MSKEKVFVVSDIHGMYDEFMELLKYWNREEQELVLLGDYVDRGLQSKEVLGFVYEHMASGGTAIKGNHDQMLLDFLSFPLVRDADFEDLKDIYSVWYNQGGRETADSILEVNTASWSALALRMELLSKSNVKDTLELLEPYYEFGNVLFVHGGIPRWRQPDWKTAEEHEMLWTRPNPFQKNETSKTIIVGHTPTVNFHKGNNCDIYLGDRTIYIDGACAYGGQLNGIVVDKDGNIQEKYFVPKKHT